MKDRIHKVLKEIISKYSQEDGYLLKSSYDEVVKDIEIFIASLGKTPRKFWVEIQYIPAESEPPEFIEAIFIQRHRENLDNVGEVFRVIEEL
jgi:hypothetical protein